MFRSITAIIFVLVLASFTSANSASASCAWSIVPSPSPGIYSILLSVSATGPSDAWAVGYWIDQNNAQHTLAEHWDGSAWTMVPSRDVGAVGSQLNGVVALSPTNAWASGAFLTVNRDARTIVEHWDGTRWSVVHSPNIGTTSELGKIAAVSPTDIWSIGLFYKTNGTFHPLAEHWDGSAWSIVPAPTVGLDSQFLGVAPIASGDVWAVGGSITRTNAVHTLAEFWNGSVWTVVKSPNITGGASVLWGASGISSSSVWAVGDALTPGETPLAEAWNGARWKIVPTPTQAGGILLDVVDLTPDDAWAINQGESFQWNGRTWTEVPMLQQGGDSFRGLGAVPGATSLWAVGNQDASAMGTLVETFPCS